MKIVFDCRVGCPNVSDTRLSPRSESLVRREQVCSAGLLYAPKARVGCVVNRTANLQV